MWYYTSMRRIAGLIHAIQQARWAMIQPLTVGVRVLLIDAATVVLVRHRYSDAWYLPGGGVKRHETLEQAIRREAREEVGARLEELHLFGVYSNFVEHKSDHVIVFACSAFKYIEQNCWEIECVQAFGLDELPASTSPGTRRRIAEYRQGYNSRYGIW